MSAKCFIILLCSLTYGIISYGQIKIGDNVSTIDDNSILELESISKVLVLTRMSNAQMLALSPLAGGLVFNTDTNCVHSYNGATWVNFCNNDSNTFSFEDNNDGTFTINYSDGTAFTSSDLTGPKGDTGEQGPAGADGSDATLQQQEIVITATNGQAQFTTPNAIEANEKIEVYRNGVKIAFTTLDANTIQLENDATCYQNDIIRIVQIF